MADQKKLNAQAVAAARRGAKFLDKQLGRGWRRKIRRSDLSLASDTYTGRGDCGCILAQIDYFELSGNGSYAHALLALGIHSADKDLGFDSKFDVTTYSELDAAWKHVLREG